MLTGIAPSTPPWLQIGQIVAHDVRDEADGLERIYHRKRIIHNFQNLVDVVVEFMRKVHTSNIGEENPRESYRCLKAATMVEVGKM